MAIRSPKGPRAAGMPNGAKSGEDESALDAVKSWLESGAWTEELYLALPEINHFMELSDGKLIVPDMPALQHQRTVRRFLAALERWNGSGEHGEAILAPYPVRLWTGKIREPDIAFYLTPHRDRMGEQIGGPPDVAVEVLSPSTRHTDLTEKLDEYARAGVPEYWIIDPDERWIDVHVLGGKRYRRAARVLAGGTASSTVLNGFTIDVGSLFSA